MEPLTPEQKALAATGFVRAKKVADWYSKDMPFLRDDIQSAAMLGVLQAAGTCNNECVWDFWLTQSVQWAIAAEIVYASRHKRRQPHTADPEQFDMLPDLDNDLETIEDVEYAKHLYGLVGPSGLETIDPLFKEGLSQRELSRRSGLTQAAISFRLTKIRNLLREQIAKEDAA